MARFLVFAALFLAALVALSYGDPTPPKWPAQYTIAGTFSIPYGNINEPVLTYWDATNDRQVISYYNGMDDYYYRYDIGKAWAITPVKDTPRCGVANSTGPIYLNLLPEIAGNFVYSGTYNLTVHGARTEVYEWTNTSKQFNYTNEYKMYTAVADGRPIRLDMMGYDFVWGSHPDKYIFTYEMYIPTIHNTSVFNPPPICNNATSAGGGNGPTGLGSKRLLMHMHRLNPNGHPYEAEFTEFLQKHGKTYNSGYETYDRMGIWKHFKDYIEDHNAGKSTFKLGMNRFGDMHEGEFRSSIMPHVHRPEVNTAAYLHPVPTLEQLDSLPTTVNWTEVGAVTHVKDQGTCGSCWTFGTTGSLEGMWYNKYKRLISLSEQQIVDCAWGYTFGGPEGNMGCGGGYASGAFQWIIDHKGIATEKHYPYLMQNSFCHEGDVSSGVTVQAYVNVTAYSESALQDAVATLGPVAVAIDASHPSFRFYTSGVYYEAQCQSSIDDLDHEVLAVGYGTDNGQDYWLVKNSWSTYWGNLGYIQMSRNANNNCGIASQATYPIVA